MRCKKCIVYYRGKQGIKWGDLVRIRLTGWLVESGLEPFDPALFAGRHHPHEIARRRHRLVINDVLLRWRKIESSKQIVKPGDFL